MWDLREANNGPVLGHTGPLGPCFRDFDLYPENSGKSSKGLCRTFEEGK